MNAILSSTMGKLIGQNSENSPNVTSENCSNLLMFRKQNFCLEDIIKTAAKLPSRSCDVNIWVWWEELYQSTSVSEFTMEVNWLLREHARKNWLDHLKGCNTGINMTKLLVKVKSLANPEKGWYDLNDVKAIDSKRCAGSLRWVTLQTVSQSLSRISAWYSRS